MINDSTPPSLISKTTLYATMEFNDTDGTLQLPADFRFKGKKIFVWRESGSGDLWLSVALPPMPIEKSLKYAGVDNDCLLPDLKSYMDEKYPSKRTKAAKA